MCHKHQKQAITMVCKACFQFNCEECHKQNGKCEKGAVGSIYSMQPMTSGKDHAYESLDDVHQQVKSKFEAIRTSVSSKLNIIAKGVKDAYKGMDDVPERFEEMKQEIKRKANEQLTEKYKMTDLYFSKCLHKICLCGSQNNPLLVWSMTQTAVCEGGWCLSPTVGGLSTDSHSEHAP
ncbi:hypothetical protein EB796_020426 [Bugula neritina]|uniref:Uncharacterized protein n=1 Tax=Bugula neritina TaxID=10212 RepID=A0A7J7J4Y5_BUGNE|nr:hypothetical protein EB796_020426 [Bugula neritina]